MTFSTKPQDLLTGQYIKLVFDQYSLGGQYKIYRLIHYYEGDEFLYCKWELVSGFTTYGLAAEYYRKMYDGRTERDVNEWIKMMQDRWE